MDVRPDPPAEELQRLAPELLVRGGSFAHRLPEFHGVPRSERDGIRLATSREWTGECLTALLATVGLPAVEPPRLSSGSRSWPQGYTGSVSKRRTNVVAAIAPTDRMRSIGIDIERQDGKGFPMLDGLDSREQPYVLPENDGQLVVFSVKEAVFKALHPILKARPDFTDIALSWNPNDSACRSGFARALGVTLEVRCSIAVPMWVVSAALWQTPR